MQFTDLVNILLLETPDGIKTRSGNINVKPEDADAVTFAAKNKSFCFTLNDGYATHYNLITRLYFYAVANMKYDITKLYDKIICVDCNRTDVYFKGILSDLIPKKVIETQDVATIPLGKFRMGYSVAGRLWTKSKVVGCWQTPFHAKQSIPEMTELFDYCGVNIQDCLFAFGHKEIDTAKPAKSYEDNALLSYNQLYNTTDNTQRSNIDQIHLLDPAIKGQVMKLNGFKPKVSIPLDLRLRTTIGD